MLGAARASERRAMASSGAESPESPPLEKPMPPVPRRPVLPWNRYTYYCVGAVLPRSRREISWIEEAPFARLSRTRRRKRGTRTSRRDSRRRREGSDDDDFLYGGRSSINARATLQVNGALAVGRLPVIPCPRRSRLDYSPISFAGGEETRVFTYRRLRYYLATAGVT